MSCCLTLFIFGGPCHQGICFSSEIVSLNFVATTLMPFKHFRYKKVYWFTPYSCAEIDYGIGDIVFNLQSFIYNPWKFGM